MFLSRNTVSSRLSSLAAEVAEHGFVFRSELDSCRSTEALAGDIGQPLKLTGGLLTHELRPHRFASPNTYSGIYGLNAFPFHSDMAHWHLPPRYLLLRCAQGYSAVATMLIDGDLLVAAVGATCLERALLRPRRPCKGKLPLFSIYRQRPKRGVSLLRWDEKFIVPASPAGIEGVNEFRKAVSSAAPRSIFLANPGDTLIVDNWRMLHGRSAVPHDCSDRMVERVYLGSLH